MHPHCVHILAAPRIEEFTGEKGNAEALRRKYGTRQPESAERVRLCERATRECKWKW